MFAKSTFLVIVINSMCKHTPKVGDEHRFGILKCIKMGKKRACLFLGNFSNGDFNRNILVVTLMTLMTLMMLMT